MFCCKQKGSKGQSRGIASYTQRHTGSAADSRSRTGRPPHSAFPASQAGFLPGSTSSLLHTCTHAESRSALAEQQSESTLLFLLINSVSRLALADHLWPRDRPCAAVTLPVQILLWEAYAPINKLCSQACPYIPSSYQKINDMAPPRPGSSTFTMEQELGEVTKAYKAALFCFPRTETVLMGGVHSH